MESTSYKIGENSYSNNQYLSNKLNYSDKNIKKYKTNIKDIAEFLSKNKNEFFIKKKLNTINNHNNLKKKIILLKEK